MKKLLLVVLAGVFCLSATNVFAQAKKETTQEKIIRLEVENRVLNEQITSLTNQIATLQSQLAAEKAKNAQQPKQQTNSGSHTSNNNKVASASKQRPSYYMTSEICTTIKNKYPGAARWAKEMYDSDDSFKIIDIIEENLGKHWVTVAYIVQGQKSTKKIWNNWNK